ncbi:cytochrome P450 family protein [Pleurotus pulmonarius]
MLRKQRLPAPLPPGPKGWPILGNIDVLPSDQVWIKYAELGRQYGGIVYLEVMGSPIIILNDAKHAFNMLATKSRNYSDRPKFIMTGHFVGWDECPALIPFSETWLGYRRLYSRFMGTKSKIEAFHNVLHDEMRTYIASVLKDPQTWTQHTRRFAGGIVLKITYGYSAEPQNDPLVKLVDEAMEQFSETIGANAYMVDIFPILRFVPRWFPGASWKRKAAKYRATLTQTVAVPYQFVKQRMSDGTAEPSFVSQALENDTLGPKEERGIQWAAAALYGGGSDTIGTGIECFFLGMTRHTDEQIQAQIELDNVLGFGHLPTLSDRNRLPYVEALFTEVMRMYTLGPTGIPHAVTEDDIHDGYFIPKGTKIITNNWQFFRDPKTYQNPECFDPRRFLGEDRAKETDPRVYVFGYGRRICPGMHLGDAAMWLACASVLASFDIRPPEENGKCILPNPRFVDGSITHPEHFECTIRPRVRLP